MNLTTSYIALCLLIASTISSFGQGDSGDGRKELAQAIVEARGEMAKADSLVAALRAKAEATADETTRRLSLNEADAARLKQIMVEAAARITPEAMKESAAQVYLGLFTKDELKGILEFYSSPAGKAMSKKGGDLEGKLREAGNTLAAAAFTDMRTQIQKDLPAVYEKMGKK